jgi:hypothetical protein
VKGAHTLHRWLNEHPLVEFLVILTAAAASHLFTVFVFDGFSHGWPARDQGAAALAGGLALLGVAVLKHHRSWLTWVNFAGFLAFQFLCLSLHHLFREAGTGEEGHAGPLGVAAVASAGVLWAAWRRAKRVGLPDVQTDEQRELAAPPGAGRAQRADEPARWADGLIVFLSLPRDPAALRAAIAALPRGAELADSEALSVLKDTNWYVTLLAIRAHLYPVKQEVADAGRPLLRVRVVPSAESAAWLGEFIALVERLAEPMAWQLEVTAAPGFERGVDFESIPAIRDAVRAAMAELRELREDGRHWVDITGGKATCSAVGAALCLEANHCFQYVSTTDQRVTLYDSRLVPVELPLHH